MTTEIYRAIFTPETWGPITKIPLITLRKGESIDAKGLNKVGIIFPNLDKILDCDGFTLITAKEGRVICIEDLISFPIEISKFELKRGCDVGVRRPGKVVREIEAIQVRKL